MEHDPEEIWETQLRAAPRRARARRALGPRDVAAIGITNQRETTVVWDRASGRADPPRHRLAVAADGADLCAELRSRGLEEEVRRAPAS